MCELFAMSSDGPATVRYSLEEFSKHGGLTRDNKDGWGIAYFEDGDVRLIREPTPAANSPWVGFIASRHLASETVIAHVRMASRGHPKLENTHPFERELGGRRHVFAHNGTMADIQAALPIEGDRYRPVGDTDSEYAFCLLLDRLHDLWWSAETIPDWRDRMAIVSQFAADVRPLGQANFIYGDSDVLFVHGQKRHYELPDGSMTEPRPPGLNVLTKQRATGDRVAAGLEVAVKGRQAMLFASVPLTDDRWVPLPEGALLAVRNGHLLAQEDPAPSAN